MNTEIKKSVQITWLGHSCFQVESEGYRVIFDPFRDGSVPGYNPIHESANEVLCSHGHADHNAVEVIEIIPGPPSPFQVTKIETWHDNVQGAKRGRNIIHILDNGTIRIAHLGDLGCELTESQKDQLKGLDAVLIPVGGFYTIDAIQAKKLVEEIQPKVTIPMHYSNAEEGYGYDVLAPVEDFAGQCGSVVYYQENTLEITPDTKAHTAILRLRR